MRIIHYLPGRVRLELPQLLNNPALTEMLPRWLGMDPGISEVTANPLSGRILIRYIPEKLGLKTIIEMLRRLQVIAAETAVTVEPAISGMQPGNTAGIITASNTSDGKTDYTFFDKQDLIIQLHTDDANGLQFQDVNARLKRYGANVLPSPPQPSVLDIFIRTLTESYMSKVLLGLGGFSLIMGKSANAFMSIGVLVANTTMAVVQERRTQNSLRMLSDMVPPKAMVLRDGKRHQAEAGTIVPGDIILLDAGEKVPADARLLSASQLVVEEASLTGESIPVFKEAGSRHRANTVYMGTTILSGRASAVVTATGATTEIGRISRTIVTPSGKTPFHQRLDEVFAILVNGGLAISGMAVLAGLTHRKKVGDIIENATGLAVSFIPDGLAPIITLATALGAMRLLKKKVALRQLSAVDTLGCTTVICCDKTGTLTCNKMEVQEVYCPDMHWRVKGKEFVPPEATGSDQESWNSLQQVFRIASLCNNAVLKDQDDGGYSAEGESTECALLLGTLQAGLSPEEEARRFKRIEETPFSSETMYMAVVVEENRRNLWSMVKGAPDIIVERCTSIQRKDVVLPFTSADREEVMVRVSQMSGRALRVLAMAYKPWEKGDSADNELVFAGLIGVMDTPRPEAKQFIQDCRRAGVKVVMITGDHKDTALAVAKHIGVVNSEQAGVLTGKELAGMSERSMSEAVKNIRVFARTSPDQKQTLVRALRGNGEIVTMVGDGVNDVPAIKEAHLGVAIAASGTAIARETSAVALTNDNVAGLLEAIKEGRNVYANIRRTMRYMITTNFGDGIVILLASLLGKPMPLTPLQLLWMNFTSDPYVSWSLANFPPEAKIMDEPPRKSGTSIFGQGLGRKILSRSLCLGLSAFMVYNGSISRGESITNTRTKTMAALGVGRLLHVSDFRRSHQDSVGTNKTLFNGGLLILSALLGATYIPGLATTLQTGPLAFEDWLPVLGWAGVGYLADTEINRQAGIK